MKARILGLLALAILASPLSAQAQNILGDWQGSVLYPTGNIANTYGLQLDMIFQTETPVLFGDSFTGELEVVCTAVSAPKSCGTGGFHSLTGFLSANGDLDFLTNGAFSGIGTLSSSGNYISGAGVDLQGTPIGFEVSRISAPEIDPAFAAASLTLFVGGLMVLRGRKRHGVAA